jgi:hypothetical protein
MWEANHNLHHIFHQQCEVINLPKDHLLIDAKPKMVLRLISSLHKSGSWSRHSPKTIRSIKIQKHIDLTLYLKMSNYKQNTQIKPSIVCFNAIADKYITTKAERFQRDTEFEPQTTIM